MGSGPNDGGNSGVRIMRAVEASLRRLGTDHLDLYQVHRPEEETDIEETLAALTDLQRAGTIRAFGTSTYAGRQLVNAQSVSERRGLARFRTNSPRTRSSCATSNATCPCCSGVRARGAGVGAPRSWVADRPIPARRLRSLARSACHTQPRTGWADRRQFDEDRPEIQRKLDVVEELAAIADGAGISMTHLAVSFTLAHPAVTSAIVGVRTPQQIDELIAGADLRLDEDTLDAIDAVVPPGSTLDENDMGFAPWWMEAGRRRLSPA